MSYARRLALGVVAPMIACTAGVMGSAPAAHAASCPKGPGHVTHGTIGRIDYASDGSIAGTTATRNGELKHSTPYLAKSPATFTYRGNRYVVGKGAQFALGCYGPSKNTPDVLYASVFDEHGKVTVHTGKAHPGGIMTQETLLNPVGHRAQSITAKVTGSASHRTTMTSTGPIIDITPEVGTHAGHCIYHHAIVATSKWSNTAQSFTLHIKVVR
jgi:hypothetical protein